MPLQMILTGDVNLMNVTDPRTPFARINDELHRADVVFSNLECCLVDTPAGHSSSNEGFFADPEVGGEALRLAGMHAVGIANNVHYGDATIKASIARLDRLGILHAGARADVPPPNRPGVPPDIITWADAAYLSAFREDIAALRPRVDVLVASCHWGLGKDVLQYMTEIAHAAIDAGADIVVGHGPHYSLPIEVYKGKPVFYGLGNFSFHTGHRGRQHGDWLGMLARLA